MDNLVSALPGLVRLDSYLNSVTALKLQKKLEACTYCNIDFEQFIKSHYVLCIEPPPPLLLAASGIESMRNVLHTAILTIMRKSQKGQHSNNVLIQGFRKDQDKVPMSATQEINDFSNTLAAKFIGDCWERLLKIVGKELMLHILTNSLILVVEQGHKSFLQLAGPPLDKAIHSQLRDHGLLDCSDALLPRYRIFYSQPLAATNQFRVGLPWKHPFNKFSSSNGLRKLACILFGDRYIGIEGFTKNQLLQITRKIKQRHQNTCYLKLFNYYCHDGFQGTLTDREPRATDAIWKSRLSKRQVFGFVKAILQRILAPCPGSEGLLAFQTLLKRIGLFLFMRRHETIPRSLLTDEFPFKQIALLLRIDPSLNIKDLKKAFSDFIYWIFYGFLMPLLKHNFYITESSSYYHRVFYFRRDTWTYFYNVEVSRLSTNLLERLSKSPSSSRQARSTLYPRLRFIPKETGFRPIVNLRKQNLGSMHGKTHHADECPLWGLHTILRYHYHHSNSIGASVICRNEVFSKICRLKSQLAGGNDSLLFFRTDVKTSFETIPQTKLMEIISKVIQYDQYHVVCFETISWESGRKKKKMKRIAIPSEKFDYLDICKARKSQNSIATNMNWITISRQKALKSLESHIMQNVMLCGDELFRQRIGIPQGSLISNLLCSFFYAELDNFYLKRFLQCPNSLLIRFIDDILFITDDLRIMNELVDILLQCGFPEYGVQINAKKTQSNFHHALIPNTVTASTLPFFPWCGFLIHQKKLTIRCDFSRVEKCRLINTMSIPIKSANITSIFHQYVRLLLNPRIHPLFLDNRINEELNDISTNLYENCIFVAFKSLLVLTYIKRVTRFKISCDAFLAIIANLSTCFEERVKYLCKHPIIHGTTIVRILFYNAFGTVYRFSQEQLSCSRSLLRMGSFQAVASTLGPKFASRLVRRGILLRKTLARAF